MENQLRSFSLILIGALLIINHKVKAQINSNPPEKYSVLSFRLGTALTREFGFYLDPVIKKYPTFTIGLGYRSKSTGELIDECFSLHPIGKTINKHTSGPYLIAGLDFKNKKGVRRVVNPSALIQIRRLTGDDLKFRRCPDDTLSRNLNFDVKTWDIVTKFYLDIGGSESFADFYIGIGQGGSACDL
ncbi:MAG: hypothetical protein GC192_21705 [Bacteroidetes bacterium]|nr:hypothetical protein [Bacteroidota bacterium]